MTIKRLKIAFGSLVTLASAACATAPAGPIITSSEPRMDFNSCQIVRDEVVSKDGNVIQTNTVSVGLLEAEDRVACLTQQAETVKQVFVAQALAQAMFVALSAEDNTKEQQQVYALGFAGLLTSENGVVSNAATEMLASYGLTPDYVARFIEAQGPTECRKSVVKIISGRQVTQFEPCQP